MLFYVFVLLAWDLAQQLAAMGQYLRVCVWGCGRVCVHAASIPYQHTTYKTHGWSACLLYWFANNAHPFGAEAMTHSRRLNPLTTLIPAFPIIIFISILPAAIGH